MPAIQGRTREQIRFGAGSEAGVVESLSASADGESDGSTIKVNTLIGGDGDQNGKHVRIVSGDPDGNERRVSQSLVVAGVTELHIQPSASAQVDSGDNFELWNEDFPPKTVDEYVTQAEIEISERGYTLHSQDEGLFGNMKQAKYDRPSGFVEISEIRVTTHVPGETVIENSGAWTESLDSDVTSGQDTEDFREGNASTTFTVAGTISAGDKMASEAIASIDISRYNTVEFWFWSDVALAASDLALLLDDTASVGSPLETILFPAIVARTWTRVQLTLANPESDTAIISVGLEYNANPVAALFKINRINALADDERAWSDPIDNRLWRPNIEDAKLEFTHAGRMLIAGRRLQITGRKLPTIMTTDSSTSQIEASILGMLVRERIYQRLILVDTKESRAVHRGSAALERTRFENGFYAPTPDINSVPVA